MVVLSSNELLNVNGGIGKLWKYGFCAIIGAATFIGAVIYGYIHPEACK